MRYTIFDSLDDQSYSSLFVSRLDIGLQKLKETNEIVGSLQEELTVLQPVLIENSKETEALLKQVAKDQQEADKVKAVVEAEAEVVGKQAAETTALQKESQVKYLSCVRNCADICFLLVGSSTSTQTRNVLHAAFVRGTNFIAHQCMNGYLVRPSSLSEEQVRGVRAMNKHVYF